MIDRPNETNDALMTLLEEAGALGTWQWVIGSTDFIWSPGLYRILGVDPGVPANLDLYAKLVHPEDRLDFGDPVRLATDGSLNDLQFRVIRADGGVRMIRSVGKVLHSPEGHPTKMIGVAFDVTEMWPALIALRKQDGLLKAIRELLNSVIWQTGPEGDVKELRDWQSNVGLQSFNPVGWGRLQAVHAEDLPLVQKAWKEALLSRKLYAADYRVRTSNGEFAVRSRGVPIIGPTGVLEGWFGITMRAETIDQSREMAADEVLTPSLVRAGRGMLDWSLSDLAKASGLSFSTIRRAEGDHRQPSPRYMGTIRLTFERHGLKFIRSGSELGVVRSATQ